MPLTYAIAVLQALPPLIKAGIDIYALVDHANKSLKRMQETGTAPTDEDWAELNKISDDLHAQIQNS